MRLTFIVIAAAVSGALAASAGIAQGLGTEPLRIKLVPPC